MGPFYKPPEPERLFISAVNRNTWKLAKW